MTTTAKILCDSLNPKGVRLTTLELYFPRFILAQLNTYGMFSRNAQSSRAIPVAKLIDMVTSDPVVPSFGENQKGMVAGEKLLDSRAKDAARVWYNAMWHAIKAADALTLLHVHKEAVNRLLEPFAHIRVILSATQWNNFFRQRLAHDAQPEMQALARAIKEAMDASTPRQLKAGDWHLPLIDERDTGLPIDDLVNLSTARCGRVSYLTHDGKRDPSADFALYDFLKEHLHLSPFEHPAKAMNDTAMHAKFKGFRQHRADIAGESGEPESNDATGFTSAPKHYSTKERECIDRIRDELGDVGFVAFCNGNVIKYRDRAGHKDDVEQDENKAAWYEAMAAHVEKGTLDPRSSRVDFVPYARPKVQVEQWIIDAVREGQELSNALREKTRGMGNITAEDLKRR